MHIHMIKEIHSVHLPKENARRTFYIHSTYFNHGKFHGHATCAVGQRPTLRRIHPCFNALLSPS